MSEIERWLESLGLGRLTSTFADATVDLDILPEITENDLEKLGIPLGDRKRLMRAIAALAEALPPVDLEAVGAAREAGPAAVSVTRPEAERRQLTVMFVDLVGSTALSARLDPEDMRAVITVYQNVCSDVIGRYEGHVAKFMGDGVLAYFGYPKAHEDDAERAVRAALELTEAVGRLTADSGRSLVARIGIATGQVVVGDLVGAGAAQEEAVVGETPNVAARLQALAAPGGVVIGPGTKRLVAGLFELTDLGEHELRGFGAKVHAWQVRGESRAESRFQARSASGLTPFVGREHELGMLLDRFEQAKEGEGQVVLLSGEPGIGKSRLAHALIERLADAPHTRMRYYCSPYHVNSALHPIIEQLVRAAGLERDDPPERRLDKLETLLSQGTNDPGPVAPLFAALLSIPVGTRYPSLNLPAQRQRELTIAALLDQVGGLAARRPVVMVLEDGHWLDPSSTELFEQVIERLQTLPVLLLITFRPEFAPPWISYPHMTALTLNRLGRRHSTEMIAAVAGGKPLPEAVLAQIWSKTEGVPLFVEELTKTVLESGLLEDKGDRYELIGPLPPLAIPTTLQDSLMARLDRLAPVKEVAQIGAVIGREFPYRLLATLSTLDETALQEALSHLVGAELVFRRGTIPDATYSFKHAFVQDAAYNSLLRVNRQKIHHRIVTTLGEDLRDQPAVLAHHWECAGELDQALEYRLAAGQGAAKQYALWEAIGQYWCALSLLEQMPETEATRRRHLEVVVALIGTGPMFWQSAAERAKALEHIDKALDTAKGTATLANLARLEAFKGNYWHDEAALRQALQHAAADGDERLRAEVARRYAGYLGRIGQFETSHTYVERAIDIYAGLGAAFEQGMAMAVEGRCYHAHAGEIGRSLQFARRAAEIAETTGDLRLKAWLAMESEPYMYQGLWKQAVDVVERNLPFAWEIGNWGVILFASAWATIAYLKLGRLAEARALIQQAVTIAARRTAYEHHQIYPQIALAQMHLVAGETEASLSAGQRALALAERAFHKMEEGAAHRILGQACETKRSSEEAEAHFQRSLAVLRAIQSRPELAQSLLAYGRFKLRDDPGEGVRLLRDALALFEEMDATGWIEETRAALDASN